MHPELKVLHDSTLVKLIEMTTSQIIPLENAAELIRATADAKAKEIIHELNEIFKKLEADLGPQSGYFSNEDRTKVYIQAMDKLLSESKLNSGSSLLPIWNKIVVDFHRSENWGYKTQSNVPKRELAEEQKIQRELFSYIWAFIQSMIVLKTAVYYFGLEFAEQRDPVNLFFLIAAISTSFGSLIFFAYRKNKTAKKLSESAQSEVIK